MTLPAQAQTLKLGHVNITKVLESMPGYQAAEKKLQEFAMQLQETVGKMEKEYAQKVQDYYDQEKDMLPAIKEVKQKEITDLESRIVKLQGSSEEQLGQKQVELLKPLEEQVMAGRTTAVFRLGDGKLFGHDIDFARAVRLAGTVSKSAFTARTGIPLP